MKIFSQNVESLRSLYIASLKKALDMERMAEGVLPDLIDRSTGPDLSSAFTYHLDETRRHIVRVENLLRRNMADVERLNAKAMDGLAAELSDTIGDVKDAAIRDMALIGVAQQIEHHEIAVYGTLHRWAELLGFRQDAGILESIEAEEVNADEILSELSERINLQAAL